MKHNKRGKLNSRAFIILLIAVLLAMQTLPASIAGPLFSYALNENDYTGDEIISDPECEEDAETASENKEQSEEDPEITSETENDTEKTSLAADSNEETPTDPPKKLMLKGTRGVSSYLDALTDRSNNIGVPYEGFADSPYTVEREVWAATQLNSRDDEKNVGGTYLLRPTDGLGVKHDYTDLDEQYWDGKMPFLIAPTEGNEGHKLVFRSYNDFSLEDNSSVVPNAALKIENLALEVRQIVSNPKMNLYARGNKFVIGEGVTTQNATSLGNTINWRLYGGTEHNRDLSGDGRPDVVTNVVVASGNWNSVFGGGEGATGTGTQVTIRGDANVQNVYGGGERKGSVGVDEPTVNGAQGNPNNPGINVYVEGGNVDTLYGGSAINGRGWLSGEPHALHINEDIKINVSGGYVNRIFGGSDTHDDNGDSSGTQPVDYSVMGDCNIFGDVTVNLSSPNVAGTVVGDINRNLPRAATNVRQVQGVTTLNVTADQELEYAELFDKINIDGANVKMKNEVGFTTFDSDYSSTEGYVGQIGVTNGGRLELTKRAVINVPYAHYNSSGSWDRNWTEPDKAPKATANHDAYYLRHGWVGESSEAKRADSVVAINGQTAGITHASGSAFNDSSDICGLRIHGSVGGAFGGAHSWNSDTPGYSTLEVLGNPIYSSGDDYFYYIVADGTASNRTGTASTAPTSVNGGEAFKEPEGADYVVCYRYLSGGKIGWYLREKGTVSANNLLVHKGDNNAASIVKAHINMNSFAYEWSDSAADNRVSLDITKYTGSDSSQAISDLSISKAELANIANDNRFSNVVYDADGYLESFDVIIDDSVANEASYYEIGIRFDAEDGETSVGEGDCARCIYDFVNTTASGSADYQDSIMTTSSYEMSPQGEDKANLIIKLPYGCEASSLNIGEDDGTFIMTNTDNRKSVSATLHSAATVRQNYVTASAETANTAFAVEIGGGDLSSGVSLSNLTSSEEYLCIVSSYRKLNRFEISNVLKSVVDRDSADGINGHIGEVNEMSTSDGLKLSLSLSGISMSGESVGSGNPSTVNYGELRILTKPLDDEIVPPITGIQKIEESLKAIWLTLAAVFVSLATYMIAKKKWRIGNARRQS